MEKHKINVLIVGGEEKGRALISSFRNSDLVAILGVVDNNSNAPAIKLAKELGIPTGKTCQEFLGNKNIDKIINTTGSKETKESLLKTKRFDIELLNVDSADLMLELISKCSDLEEDLKKAHKELELKSWGMEKTNDGIKTLYRELAKKNEELKKLDKIKSDFISIVSHELRTPLTIIRESVSQVLEGILGETTKEQQEFLSIGLKDIDRLARIINNLLDIAKIENGKFEIKKERIDLAKIVRDICSTFHPRVKNKGIEIKAECLQDEMIVHAEKDKIIQVLNNLIGNSFKFTKRGGIIVTVADKEDHVECSVADTGKGMSKEDVPRIFSKFEQFGRKDGPGDRGTGLGLAISKGIIELYKGKIEIESELGKGTTFTFTLPKYTPRELFVEEIKDGVNEAKEQESSLSAGEINIDINEEAETKLGKEKICEIINSINGLIEENLHRSKDMTVCDGRSIMIVLPLTEKDDANKIIKRLGKIITGYLTEKGLKKRIKVGYRIMTYPQEAKTVEELFEKFKK